VMGGVGAGLEYPREVAISQKSVLLHLGLTMGRMGGRENPRSSPSIFPIVVIHIL